MKQAGSIKLLQQQAYEYLNEQILLCNLEEGVIYSETQVARDIGISRTPMREALLRLSQNKIVDIIPSKGFRLHEMTPEDAIETYQVRAAIEGFAATMIAQENSSERGKQAIRRINELIDLQDNLYRQGADPDQLSDVDQQMHVFIVEYVQNASLSEQFHNHLYRIRQFAISTFKNPARIVSAVEEHRSIVAAMEAGDIARVYAAVLNHMKEPQKMMIDSINARQVKKPILGKAY